MTSSTAFYFFFFFFDSLSPLNLQLAILAKLTGQQALGFSCLFLPVLRLQVFRATPGIFRGCWELGLRSPFSRESLCPDLSLQAPSLSNHNSISKQTGSETHKTWGPAC